MILSLVLSGEKSPIPRESAYPVVRIGQFDITGSARQRLCTSSENDADDIATPSMNNTSASKHCSNTTLYFINLQVQSIKPALKVAKIQLSKQFSLQNAEQDDERSTCR